MWWKLLLLTLYLAVLFLLSRILETFAYYETGYLSGRLLDPFSLSVKKLRILLDQRGVSYTGVVEKKELSELVENSGETTEGELETANLSTEDAQSNNFTCGSHFYEEVEDTKDSVWLVQVVQDQSQMYMHDKDWRELVRRVSRFGIRTGIFDCSLDYRLCNRRNWFGSRVVLALPHGYRAKDAVDLHSYTHSSKPQAVFNWVNKHLASRIIPIKSVNELENKWLKMGNLDREAKIRVLLFSVMNIPPMFFSVLSAKFSGRVKFGTVNIKTPEGRQVAKHANLTKKPLYMVLSPEGNFTFGTRSGEYLNYRSMALFLKCLHPEVNDVFLLTLMFVNLMCWFELLIYPGNLFHRLGGFLWNIGKWNCFLILLWLPIIGLFQLSIMDQLLQYVLMGLRWVSMTVIMAKVRVDWQWYLTLHPCFLAFTFLLYATIVALLHHKYSTPSPLENNNVSWWNMNLDNYLSYLFRPMASLTHPSSSHDTDLEVGMELLIERLAIPNLWLRPMINSDYVKDLPTWRYTGQAVESDIGSDTDSLRIDSGDELEGQDSGCDSPPLSPLPKPYMFICERCRALQTEQRSMQEIEQDQIATESACAKFLMDGNYKCTCHADHNHETLHPQLSGRASRNSSRRRSHHTSTELFDESELRVPEGMLPCTECAICLERYRFGVGLCGLPCGHSFHEQCIMGWLSRDNHCCPVCRWPTYKAKPCSIHEHIE